MSKDTYYFSHDYNARNDSKIKNLLFKHGYLGYGLFWAIIEELYNNANSLPIDFDILAYDLRSDKKIIESIIKDFDLFVFEGNSFGSLSVQTRLDDREEKSNKSKKMLLKRWGVDEKRNKAKNTILYILKMYNHEEEFLKCGITSESISRRYSGKTPYKFDIIISSDIDCEIAMKYESEFFAKFAKYEPKIRFAGYLECLKYSELDILLDFAILKPELRNTILIFRNTIKERKGKEIESNNNYNLFISLFNKITGRSFLGSTKIKSSFNARVKDGFTLDQFEKAITNCFNDKFHKDNPKYLTPEFITRHDKLEMYLNAETKKELTQEEKDAIYKQNFLSRL